MTKQKSYVFTAAKISGILLLICACVAFVVSFAYSLTIDAYNANLEAEISKTLTGIFDVSEQDTFAYTTEETDEYTLYTVTKNGDIYYCIQLEGKGFGGAMSVMIGYNTDKTISGVSVISHAETPGIGTKALDPTRLEEQYAGKGGSLSISKKQGECDVDAVGGATISSKAIHEAINRANAIIDAIN